MTNKRVCPCDFCRCSGRVCERRASGSGEVQVLPQGAHGHVRQPPAVAHRGQRGNEGFSLQENVREALT